MSGNQPRPDGTSDTGPLEPAKGGRVIRRFDAPHAKPRLHSVDPLHHEPVLGDGFVKASTPEPHDDADDLACENVADRLMSTQAAQLAEYLRNRQAELIRRQQQLEEQQHSLHEARLAFEAQRGHGEAERGPPEPPVSRPADASPDRDTEATIRLLLAALEQHRVAHQAAFAAVPRPNDASTPAAPSAATGSTTSPADSQISGERSRESTQDREDQVARQAAATQQMLQEVRRVHQETLETRLVTEQLWVQLSGLRPHDELSRSLRQLRDQFQQQQRQSREDLAIQQQEVRERLAHLEQRQLHLRRQRRDLQTWVDQRYQEFEQIAGQLIARQQELERQQRQFEQQRRMYEEELLQYQRQIKQLTAQLRCRDELGRVA